MGRLLEHLVAAVLAAAALYVAVDGTGGRCSSAVPWGVLVAVAVLAGAGAACLVVSPGTAVLALLGLVPGLILSAFLLVPPSRR